MKEHEQKELVILELCLFRHGVKLFEDRVNVALASGWTLKNNGYNVSKHGWFRTLCEAVLVKEDGICNPSK